MGAQKLRSGEVNVTSNQVCIDQYASEYQGSSMICGSNLPDKGEMFRYD